MWVCRWLNVSHYLSFPGISGYLTMSGRVGPNAFITHAYGYRLVVCNRAICWGRVFCNVQISWTIVRRCLKFMEILSNIIFYVCKGVWVWGWGWGIKNCFTMSCHGYLLQLNGANKAQFAKSWIQVHYIKWVLCWRLPLLQVNLVPGEHWVSKRIKKSLESHAR